MPESLESSWVSLLHGVFGVFGLVVAGTMEAIRRWHLRNLRAHAAEVERLLEIARTDHH